MKCLRFCAAATALLATGLVLANRIDIVSEAQAPQQWRPDPAQRQFVAGYPEAAPNKTLDVCVDIGYLIKTDGTTSNYTEMKSWGSAAPDGALAQSDADPYVQIAAAVVSRWHFVPVGKPHSIYTAATFAFDGSHAAGGEEAIRAHCRIDDLPTFVARAKAREDARGDITRSHQERQREDRSMVEPMGTSMHY